MLRTNVLVIGGGPAGAIAAMTLARGNIDTVLAEKSFSYVKPCGGGVPSTAFSEFQLPSACVARYVNTIKIISPSGDVVPIGLHGAAIAIVSRGEFDSCLRAEAGRSGAQIVEAEFRQFAHIGRTISAEVLMEGRPVTIEADYVIAADGVNSRVRAALRMKPVPSLLALVEKIPEEEADSCEFWFGSSHAPRLYSWVFPQKEGISLGTGAIDPREIKTKWQRFCERRALHHSLSLPPGRSRAVRGYRIPLWKGDLYGRGRILFAGDSAGQVLPLTYEGIYYAMKSGELAARAAIAGKERSYKRLWERAFCKRFSLMKHLWEYFLKNDSRSERLVQLHKRPEVQEASMRLWLRKDRERGSLISYRNIFRGLLNE
ncbi:MAG TPA: NAD(P)/FAD-dependent oxidoreductase [Thermodesulfovibrionales bacterium]|nr:NAD(P)/FAD-dependent oxidoreductase [Thermodesulfovibrionales bacterium]